MTTVMRYRAEEDGGEVAPPKPHRLPPLEGGGDGAANTEGADSTSTVPRPPDRPMSGDGGKSPKTRMVKSSASGAQAETADSMSGASTADSVNAEGIEKKSKAGQRVSLTAPANGADPSNRTGGNRSLSVQGTGWTQSAGMGSEKLQQRRSMVGPPTTPSSMNPREICNFYYRQAEQRWLWCQMQNHSSGLEGGAGDILSIKASGETEATDKMDLGILDDDVPALPAGPSAAAARASLAVSDCNKEADKGGVVRRQSVYILKAEELAEAPAEPCPKKKKKGKSNSNPSKDDPATTAAGDATGPSIDSKGPNPFKDLMTAKKVDLEAIRTLFSNTPDAKMWLGTLLDPGPPLIPTPIVFAVSMNDPKLVDLMIELGAKIPSVYDGPSMYKGWLKPGASLISSIQNRKGRFVGTMLADKLTDIEMKIMAGIAAQHAKAGPDDEKSDEEEDKTVVAGEIQIVDQKVEETTNLDGETTRRKSVAVKITGQDKTMRHTQGHPGDVFEISEHLGDGDRSSVWLGFHKETKAPVAIKTEQKSTAIEAWLWEEINLMRKVEHPNIAQLFETFESEKQIFMVLELCEGGRLLEKCTPESCAIVMKSPTLLRQCTMAVSFLHNKNIAHRDIQLDNFLLADEKPLATATIKLIDFTTAKMFGGDQPPLKTKICTPGYVAKEILTRKEIPYTEKVDIWSLGVVFFILLSGAPPFYGTTDMETLKQVKKGAFKFEPEERWAPVPDEAKQLITSMINPSVEDRLTSNAVLAHTFIANA